ncbi:flagellar hook-length control protein FliK [Nitrosomonas oligotropha]|uniref:Flagellar hook-length control protein FliK n=1 Tax=Nitrosomonas oligotropha TaxID=42354 RepID=A0A2T5I1Y1_9PROT|nr:flagellar hook-length control protein FliK [Nitrosomonas oligotropha]PTQ77844.1 flagellar hook-length control protein FliK [Nitrosomonas oligotropha]
MLNISVAPQIRSSGESTAALISAGSSGTNTNDAVTEDFGKVLDRQVSEATDKQDKHKQNDATNAADQERSDNTIPEKDKDTDSAADAPADGTNSFIQSLLTDATVAYKTTPSLQAMGAVVNPDAMMAASTLPQGVTSLPADTTLPQEGEQIAHAVTPAVNQLLQQGQSQANSVAGTPASLPNNYWQYLGTADSAAYGKFLPPSEMKEDIQLDNAAPIFKTQEEPITTQSFGLNSTTAATSQTAVSPDVKVDAPVGQHRWGGEFAQKVVWLTSQQHQVAEIRLNPAHLGPVEVMLSITQDQATAQFISPHSAVRDAIQEALPRLREMMAESGIQLGNVMVGADSFQQENKQQQAQYAGKDTGTMSGMRQEVTGQVQTAAVPIRHQGLVNTYA